MTTVTRNNSSNRMAKPVYKDYVNFLGNYNNKGAKKDDQHHQDKNYPLSSSSQSSNNSSSSLSSDVPDFSKPTCTPYSNYLESCKNKKFNPVRVNFDDSHNLQNGHSENHSKSPNLSENGKKETMRSEIYIEIQNSTPVTQVLKIFERKDLIPENDKTKTQLKQTGISSMINMFEQQPPSLKEIPNQNISKTKQIAQQMEKTRQSSSSTVKIATPTENNTDKASEKVNVNRLVRTMSRNSNSSASESKEKVAEKVNVSRSQRASPVLTPPGVKKVSSSPPPPPLPTFSTQNDTHLGGKVPNSESPPLSPPTQTNGFHQPSLKKVEIQMNVNCLMGQQNSNILQPAQVSTDNSGSAPPPPPPPMQPLQTNGFHPPSLKKAQFHTETTSQMNQSKSVNNIQSSNKIPNNNVVTSPPPPPPMQPLLQTNGFHQPVPMKVQNGISRNSNVNAKNNNSTMNQNYQIDRNDPQVRKLVYGTLRGMYGAYHDKANDFVATLPRNMVKKDNGVQKIIEHMAANGDLDKLNGRVNPKSEQD